MAGIVDEQYEWQPTVKIGDVLRQNARVRVWDYDGDSIVNLLTNAAGQIPTQNLKQQVLSITLTSTVTPDQETPHRVRTLYIGDADLGGGKYGTVVDQFNKDLGQTASLNTIFLDVDDFITHTKTAIDLYAGIAFTHGSQLITLSAGRTIAELYEYCSSENYDNPQYATEAIMATVDGNTFQVFYDLVISTGTTVVGGGKTLVPAAGKDVTFQGTANFSGGLSVGGNVTWGTNLTIDGLNVSGTFEFTTAGTYNISNSHFETMINSSGGAVIINASGFTNTTNTGPNITVNESYSVTLTGLQANSEVRAYVGTNPATAVEIDGVENSTTSFAFLQSEVGNDGYIVVHHVNYVPLKIELTYANSNQTIPVSQTIDRSYDNPA